MPSSTADDDKVIPLRKARSCPICGQPSERSVYPFCSPRCKDIDLNRWLTGAYAIPVVEEDGGSADGESS